MSAESLLNAVFRKVFSCEMEVGIYEKFVTT